MRFGLGAIGGWLALALGCGQPGDEAATPPATQVTPAPSVEEEVEAGRQRARKAVSEARRGPRRAGRGRSGVDAPGKWRKLRAVAEEELSVEQAQRIEELEALGYVDGSEAATTETVVTVYDAERVAPGLALFNSGHAAEAFVTTLQGEVLHRWHKPFAEAFPDTKAVRRMPGVNHWRRAKLGEGGRLYAIFEGRGLVALGPDSEVLWTFDGKAHHDLVITPKGELLVLTRKGSVLPGIDRKRPVLRDFLVFLDPDTGAVRRRIDLLAALLDSPFADRFEALPEQTGDVFHTNSVQWLDGSVSEAAPVFSEGRVLVSMRTPSALGVVDLETERFVWWHTGDFSKQHDAEIIPETGELMLFDNAGGPGGSSRVLALDPATLEVTWSYQGTDDHPFRSATLGTVQRLPDDHVLITESDGGRAFEVTRDGEIVWEFYNPHRAGEDDAYIAALFEMTRLPASMDRSWMVAP